MVRNIVVLGGSSHPQLTETICNHLGIPPAKILLGKFSVGETRVEIFDSVRGKDVFIIQSGGGAVNDHLMELLITISACKTASAKRVTAVLPLFPYSRQSDIPYNKQGAPLARVPVNTNGTAAYTFDSRPQTPYPGEPPTMGLNGGTDRLNKKLSRLQMAEQRQSHTANETPTKPTSHPDGGIDRRDTLESTKSEISDESNERNGVPINGLAAEGSTMGLHQIVKAEKFQPQRGYKQWVAQAGTLIADLLTCAGADHVITMDLHDPQYQGFFDIPVDNLYGRHLLRRYIQNKIPNYQQAVIVSPDAGGAKRATAIADALGMPFALIHKVCSRVLGGQGPQSLIDGKGAPTDSDNGQAECHDDACRRHC